MNKVGFPISVIGNTIPAYESREFTVDKIPSVNKKFATVEVIKETAQQVIETKSVEPIIANESTEEEVVKPAKRKSKKSQPTTDEEENTVKESE